MKSGIMFALVGLLTFGVASTEVNGHCLLAQILKLKKHPPPDSPTPNEPKPPVVQPRPPIVDVEVGKPGRDGKDGRDGQNGKDGLPGKDAPPVDLSPILDALAKLEKRLDAVAEKAGKDGKDGLPGPPGPAGKDAPAVDLSAIAAAIAKLELRIDALKPGAPSQPIDIDKIAEEVKKKLPPYPAYFEIIQLPKK